MGTPLEEIEEYEPLFPEGEEGESKPKKAIHHRPGLAHHHFPSQDVWEDTPSSLQYQTTVDTPEPPSQKTVTAAPAAVFETPEQEQRRREENPEDMTSDNKTFVKPHFKSGVLDDLHRPGAQRFPSRDIWEDTPDSMQLVTTVSSPQMDETKSPPEDRPTTAALPGRQDDDEARSTTGFTQMVRPHVPGRPERRSKLAHEIKPDLPSQTADPRAKEVPDIGTDKPQLPDRTKPTVPARPAKFSHSDQAQGSSLVKPESVGSDDSADTVTSPPAPKAKPPVPARPAGSKIAALQAGFMNDLNNRLKLGPQPQPKVKEPEVESEEAAAKEPLADARKSRAKGPARRKPAASPSAGPSDSTLTFSISTPITLWQIDENDELSVPAAAGVQDAAEPELAQLEKVMSDNEAKNTEEPTLTKPEPHAEAASEAMPHEPPEVVTADNDKPNPLISESSVQKQQVVQPGLETALAHAEPAPASAEDAEQRKLAGATTGQMDDVEGREVRLDAGDVGLRGGNETNADA